MVRQTRWFWRDSRRLLRGVGGQTRRTGSTSCQSSGLNPCADDSAPSGAMNRVILSCIHRDTNDPVEAGDRSNGISIPFQGQNSLDQTIYNRFQAVENQLE